MDTRSIVDVQPEDLEGYVQCHFFAGIGGWALAARLAGWPEDRELWTGSPPCQPFSSAGKGLGAADERHLWPHFFRLIRVRRPAVVMGEQVAAAVGKHWLDGVFADLEGIDYTGRALVVPACAVNAPHRRDRLWFLAERGAIPCGAVGHSLSPRLEGHPRHGDGTAGRQEPCGPVAAAGVRGGGHPHNPWDTGTWIVGHDGKVRRVEPSIPLLADGVPARVGRLRAYGNAIVPQIPALLMRAYMDTRLD